jgi:A/G-specific adenine glycosylase
VVKRVPRAAVELLQRPNNLPVLSANAAPLRRYFSSYYRRNARHFPWRIKGREAFHILIAELLLVQTKAPDVARVWPALIARYPSPRSLADAPVLDLIRYLRPLGLQRQRAHALKAVSRALVAQYHSKVPRNIHQLLSLPYVGLYIASAVRAFAFEQRTAIVDANVLRVFSRITGENFGKDTRRAPGAWAIAWSILPTRSSSASEHHFGLLDFAAQVCKKRPQCNDCGLLRTCHYGTSIL